MNMSDENSYNQGLVKPGNRKEMMMGGGNRKFGVEIRHNRRDLNAINQNVVGSQPYPCVFNKRSLSQKNTSCDKEVENQVHRPITRKFAAQIASTKQCLPAETKKAKPSPENFTIWEDSTITDVEEQKTTADHPAPMFLETRELIEDEKDEMEEVEMEDIFEETVLDIDSDTKNPLAAVEYVKDIFSYYRKMESCSGVSPHYMVQQSDINEKMRAILIDWLIEVHHKFDLQDETLFLTVNLIDRFLAKHEAVRKKLQLIGLVALLLACKYEEVSVPIVEDLIYISDEAYSRKEILEMEKLMLNTLQFNMSVPTPYVFLKRFLKAAESDTKLERLSFFLIELCLVEYEMIKFPPSFLAASAIYTAHCSLYGFKQWSKNCQWHSNYSEDQLLECSRLIVGYHQKAATGRLTGVYRKYNTSKFGFAAKYEPANFLAEETSH